MASPGVQTQVFLMHRTQGEGNEAQVDPSGHSDCLFLRLAIQCGAHHTFAFRNWRGSDCKIIGKSCRARYR